jgi:hypothetical protein
MKDNVEEKLLKELGLSADEVLDITSNSSCPPSKLNPVLAVGIGTAFVLNVAVLLSLPPVLRGKGKLRRTSLKDMFGDVCISTVERSRDAPLFNTRAL